MWNAIKRIIEFIKFVIGAMLVSVGMIIGGITKFIANICEGMVELGVRMATGLCIRYIPIEENKTINEAKDVCDVV